MIELEVRRRVSAVIERYISASGYECPRLRPSTKLMRDAGLSSDDGVNVVLDLCTEFAISLPVDFNATVHDNGKRDRTFNELVVCIKTFINEKEQTR